jgi:predicted RNA-binding Zn-ribbon protein involved in translation (DUF1610 family)
MPTGRSIQIGRKSVADFRCPHCGTMYELIWQTPACDNGSAECDECQQKMLRWSNSAIPSFRRKTASPLRV